MFASVIVDLKYQDSQAYYDYIIPEHIRSFLVRGMRVIIPFQHQMKLGVVFEIKNSSELATKEIFEVLDAYPSVSEEIFMLADFLKESSNASYGHIFYQLIPKELMMNFKKIVYQLAPISDSELSSKFNRDSIWRLKKSDQIYYPKLKRLEDKGIVDIDIEISKYTKPKFETYYQYQMNHHYLKAFDEMEIINKFHDEKMIKRSELIDLGLSPSRIKTWLKHDVIKEEKLRVKRDRKHILKLEEKVITLTDEQKVATDKIIKNLGHQHTFLLKGVTGSGKTEVYIKLIEEVIKQGKKVLVLVPEIMQVPQMVLRLKSKFKEVAIYHSGLSKGEALDEFEQIISGKADVICGTRSASFIPISDLGLIIVDEEHDPSYIQTEGVYYDAKKLLILKSKFHQIPIVFGSATPTIEMMYQAKEKKIDLLELKKHHQGVFPTLHFVDMKEELKQKNTSILSNTLKTKIQDRLNKKEQVILLYNKKGYAPYVLCRDCGHVPRCPHCDVSLTLYKSKNILKCHYCGYEETYQKTCPVCQGQQVKEVGVGIEYVESVVKRVFPEARVLRLDKEMTKTKNQHEIIYHEFKEKNADILIGTQMVSKGLDFEHVTLVGIILADASFRVPAYDANEQAYMLFTQVSGRSGRHLDGEVIVQGYNLDHQTLRWLKSGYDMFYKDALGERKLLNYPPFIHLSTIIFEGKSLLTTYQEAFKVKKRLLASNMDVLGPAEALKKKVRDQFRYSLTIKHQEHQRHEILNILELSSHKDVFVSYYPTIER
ncbi:MAG: primosomal protein N' [Acholeplasmataceae bacterium]